MDPPDRSCALSFTRGLEAASPVPYCAGLEFSSRPRHTSISPSRSTKPSDSAQDRRLTVFCGLPSTAPLPRDQLTASTAAERLVRALVVAALLAVYSLVGLPFLVANERYPIRFPILAACRFLLSLHGCASRRVARACTLDGVRGLAIVQT